MICLITLAAHLLQCNQYQHGSFKASQQLFYATLYSHASNAQQLWVTQAMRASLGHTNYASKTCGHETKEVHTL